jgi:hypothetical protein
VRCFQLPSREKGARAECWNSDPSAFLPGWCSPVRSRPESDLLIGRGADRLGDRAGHHRDACGGGAGRRGHPHRTGARRRRSRRGVGATGDDDYRCGGVLRIPGNRDAVVRVVKI